MNKKRLIKLALASGAGFGAVAGATVVAVSCGSSQSYSPAVYAYNYSQSVASGAKKTGKNLIVWLSYKTKQTEQLDRLTPALEKVLTDAGYSVSYVDDSTVNYANVSRTLSTKFQSGDYATLPDVILNYPDIQAILESYGLAQDYDDAAVSGPKLSTLVTPAWQFDINSVFTSKPGAYALPLLKSTDLMAFDIPAFAVLLNDIAAQREDWETFEVKANSAQQRILYMLMSQQTPQNYNVSDVYVERGSTTYKWSDIADMFKTKTEAGGIWEKDLVELKKHFALKQASKSTLLGIDWSQDIFDSYDGIKLFSQRIVDAYSFLDRTANVMAVDSVSNTIYSYQYDLAGHSSEGFFIRPETKETPPRMVFDFSPSTPSGNALAKATDYVSSLINMNALGVKQGDQDWASNKFLNHSLFFALISSNAVARSTPLPNEKNVGQTTLGDVYFDLQPSKAGPGELKRSIINQGPSLFVTKAHPEESAKIAGLFKTALANGVFSADYRTDGFDYGIFGTDSNGKLPAVGYSYVDARTYAANSSYLAALDQKVVSSANWPSYVSKYLLKQYLLQAEANHWNSFNNPAASNTSLIRNWFNEKYQSYKSAGYASGGSQVISEVVNYIVPDARLYKLSA